MASPSEVPALDGLLLVDKPAGISSHAVVARIRRAAGKATKVGHAGTLDPFATGLMLVLVGRGTRIAQFLSGLDKRYETWAQLGARSTTGDPEGEITHTGRVPESPLSLPVGTITQRPPAYSAIKIDGERAYRRVRRGEEVTVPERTVELYEFRELGREGDRVQLAVHCSSGTYIRTLVQDLGDGYCLTLRRTAVGPWSIDEAAPLERFETREAVAAALIDLPGALPFLPHLQLGGALASDVRHGRKPAIDRLPATISVGTPVLLLDDDGAIAVGRSDGTVLRTVVGFRA